MPAPVPPLPARLALLAAVLAGPLSAADVLPAGATFKVNDEATQFAQRETQAGADDDADLLAFAWHTPLGSQIALRLYDGDGDPLGPQQDVNTTFAFGNQSEPEVVVDELGNVMVAWSDWSGNDGDLMGIFGRVYGPDGVPRGPDFQVNESPVQSQWEPKGAPRPGGGFVMGWSGTADGDAYFRVFDADGVPLTGDIEANAFKNNAQIDTALATNRGGRILVAYEDFGGNGGLGTGQNIFVRVFEPDGTPVQPVEIVAHENTLAGNQKEPRAGGDGLGNFVVVWEHRSGDADGSAIWARRFDADGQPLGPEFRVNEAQAGDQLRPDVAVDWVGNAVITWQDASTGTTRAMARRYDWTGAPAGAPFVVADDLPGAQSFPSVAGDWAGEDLVVTLHAPGGPDTDGSDDVYARRLQVAPLTVGGTVAPGETFTLDLDVDGGAGLDYVILAALGTEPGLPLPDGRTLPLTFDPLLQLSLFNPDGAGFSGLQGVLDDDGEASGSVALPPTGPLCGATLHFAAVTLDLARPSLVAQLRHVTDPVAVTIP